MSTAEADPVVPIEPAAPADAVTPDLLVSLYGSFKKGIVTSEFWVSVISAAFAAAMLAYDRSEPFSKQVAVLGIAAAGGVYTLARTWLKTQRLKSATATTDTVALLPAPTPTLNAMDYAPPLAPEPESEVSHPDVEGAV